MKNKILDHFLLFSNFFLIIGIVITSILFIKGNGTTNPNLSFLPYIIFLFVSVIFASVHIFLKKNYLMLIKMHISKKTIYSYLFSFCFTFFIMLFSCIWMVCVNFLPYDNALEGSWYFYTLIGISMFLTIVNICIDSYARFGVKIDLTKKRMGEPFDTEKEVVKN